MLDVMENGRRTPATTTTFLRPGRVEKALEDKTLEAFEEVERSMLYQFVYRVVKIGAELFTYLIALLRSERSHKSDGRTTTTLLLKIKTTGDFWCSLQKFMGVTDTKCSHIP